MLVYFCLQYVEPRYIGLLVLILLVLRFCVAHQQWQKLKPLIPIFIAGSGCCVLVMVVNNATLLKLYPVLINLALFLLFTITLVRPPSMIERFARLTTPDLPQHAISYTRNVTIVWCSFFVLNATTAAITTFYASMEVWTLYNGLIAYLLMGLIFIVEYIVRQFKMRASK